LFSLSFLYPLLHFMQIGVLLPQIGSLYPEQILSALILLRFLVTPRTVGRVEAFRHPALKWAIILQVFARGFSLVHTGVSQAVTEVIDWLPVTQYLVISLLVISSRQSLIRYISGVIVGSGFIILYGIVAVFAGWREDMGGLAGAYGNYENHNDYSFIIIQTLPFLYLIGRTKIGFLKNVLRITLMAACVFGMFLSRSRGGMLALVLEIVLIVCMTMEKKKRMFLLPLVVVLGVGMVAVQYARRAELGGDYTEATAESSRYELWTAGKNMFLAYPIFGVGSRLFADYSKQYGELSHDQLGKNAHNTYIQVIATMGIFGAWCFLSMLAAIRREFRKKPSTDSPLADNEWIRLSGLIVFYSMLFRAIFDAKDHDWCWFFMVVVACSMTMLRIQALGVVPDASKDTVAPGISAQPGAWRRGPDSG
jgi:O-antigen ligase